MAEVGINWSAWTAATYNVGTPWTAIDAGGGVTLLGDAIDLDNKIACEVSVLLLEDEATAITADVSVSIKGDTDGTNFEHSTSQVAPQAWELRVTPVVSDSVYKRLAVSPKYYGSFKIDLYNIHADIIKTTVKYRTGTVPAAS